ncbi:diguanylate cyclase [Pantoea sp. App145]|uniref:diguanylate cyclase n=1 Tax=Pantoea sp. App145 TaxID=3071567 RepID=UPI003A7FC2FA
MRPDVSIFLVIMDLDYFKLINDRYGHPVGDSVLTAAADVIRDNIREGNRQPVSAARSLLWLSEAGKAQQH